MTRLRSLLLLAVGVFCFQWWRSSEVNGPFLFHDEFGYVAVTRWLAGPQTPELVGPLYHPGYGLLLVPIEWLTSGPAQFHAWTTATNAGLAAILFLATAQLGKHWGLGLKQQLAAGLAASLTASVTLFTAMLVPEVLLSVLTIASVLAARRFFEAPSNGNALLSGVATATIYLVHPRGIVAAIALGLTVAAFSRNRFGVVCICALGASLIASQLGVMATEGAMYFRAESFSGELLPDAIDSPSVLLRALLGTTWYLVASTFGLAVFAGLAVARALIKSDSEITPVATFIGLGVMGSLTLSALFTNHIITRPQGGRPDVLFYGRYVGQWIPVLLVLAIFELSRSADRWRWFGLAAVAGIAVVGPLVAATFEPSTRVGPTAISNSSALGWYRFQTGQLDITRWGWLIAAVLSGLTLLVLINAEGKRQLWWVPLVGVVVWGQLAANSTIGRWAAPASDGWRVDSTSVTQTDGKQVYVIDSDPLRIYGLQYWNPELDIDITN